MKPYLLMFALPLALAACSKPPHDAPAVAAAAPTQAPAAVADVPTLSSYHWHLSEAKDARASESTRFSSARTSRCSWISSTAV